MATSFQPEKPYEPSKPGRGGVPVFIVAGATALISMMIVALAVPSADEKTNWLLTIAVGAVVFAVMLVAGLVLSRKRQTVK